MNDLTRGGPSEGSGSSTKASSDQEMKTKGFRGRGEPMFSKMSEASHKNKENLPKVNQMDELSFCYGDEDSEFSVTNILSNSPSHPPGTNKLLYQGSRASNQSRHSPTRPYMVATNLKMGHGGNLPSSPGPYHQNAQCVHNPQSSPSSSKTWNKQRRFPPQSAQGKVLY